MDLDVRWFRREVALSVARRLAVETCAAVAAAAAVLALTLDPATAVIGALLTLPTFLLVRVGSSFALNPTSSAYLIRWPRPAGPLRPLHDDHEDARSDIELTAAGFVPLGFFSEWGGNMLSVHTNRQDTLALSSDDQLILLSGLDDGRLCISTTHLVPPHDQLVVNHRVGVDDSVLVAAHAQLASELIASGIGPIDPHIDLIGRFLTLEWDIWHAIGPFLGPFVRVGPRRQPSLILARVASADILDRGRVRVEPATPGSVDEAAAPEAKDGWPVVALDSVPDEAQPEDDLAATLIDILERDDVATSAAPEPTPRETPIVVPRGLSALAAQAERAAERTDRALAAGETGSFSHAEPGREG